MKTVKALTATLVLFVMPPVHAGKTISACRDAQGNAYFSDVGCPAETEVEGRVYASDAQTYGAPVSSGSAISSTYSSGRMRRGGVVIIGQDTRPSPTRRRSSCNRR